MKIRKDETKNSPNSPIKSSIFQVEMKTVNSNSNNNYDKYNNYNQKGEYSQVADNSEISIIRNVESNRLIPENQNNQNNQNRDLNTTPIPGSPTPRTVNSSIHQPAPPNNNYSSSSQILPVNNKIPPINQNQNQHHSNLNHIKKLKFDGRRIIVNNPIKNKKKYKYEDNFVTTSKYTVITFFPKSLMLQFMRYANIYFLIMAVLQSIPLISPLSPVTAIAPFIFVLAVSMVREALEDYKRHISDKKENSQIIKVWRKNSFIEDLSKNLEIGDIVLTEEYSMLPADLILLSCSNISKIAFIETANLDGEKNLKPKYCIPQLFNYFKDCNKLLRLRGKIKCDKPNADLTKFSGYLKLSEKLNMPLSIKQFLYKGTLIKNTKWVVGVVIGTGRETKIILNSQKGASKQSHLESTVNKLIGIIFIFQCALSITTSILTSYWVLREGSPTKSYLELGIDSALKGFLSFWTYLLLLNTLIPISLIVTLELVKAIQGYLMNCDYGMYSHDKLKFANANITSLNEELGQIKYIFSDKTGTLTANKLVFTACAIGDELFGMSLEEISNNDPQTQGLKRTPTVKADKRGKNEYSFNDTKIREFTIKGAQGRAYNDIQLYSTNQLSSLNITNQQDVIFHYLYNLSLNHTCFVDRAKKVPKIGLEKQNYRPLDSESSIRQKQKKSILKPNATFTQMHTPNNANNMNNMNNMNNSNSMNVNVNVNLNTKNNVNFNTNVNNMNNPSNLNNLNSKKILSHPNNPNLKKNIEFIEKTMTKDNDIEDDFNDIIYKGENPDEVILVDAARHMGFIYESGDETVANLVLLKENGGNNVTQKIEILYTFEFTSTRGMMSTIVKMDNNYIVYSKGGDLKIKRLLAANQPFVDKILEIGNQLSEKGLRVLLLGMKIIHEDEWNEWFTNFDNKMKGISDEKEINNFKVEQYEILERGLTLIGCTAVEDKLQENVPNTIRELQTAKINVWVLTGDNLPTAKNIEDRMDIYELNDDPEKFKNMVSSLDTNVDVFTPVNISRSLSIIQAFEKHFPIVYTNEKVGDQGKKALLYTGLMKVKEIYDKKKNDISLETGESKLQAVLVESSILRLVLPSDDDKELIYYGHPLTQLFLSLTLESRTVLCCRVAPIQKALVVRMIKNNIKDVITLSVGDGANDVSMIMEADVGIGIYGEEGTQAARSSDYSIGEFQCLKRLILYHGRLNYIRLADMILYFFYKNFVFTIPHFYFGFFNGYSGNSCFEDMYITGYNMVFTALPLLVRALLDRDFNDDDGEDVSRLIPHSYYVGREGIIFNIKNFCLNIFLAIIQSVAIYYLTIYMYATIPLSDSGFNADHWVVNFKILINQMFHTQLNTWIMILTSYALFIVYLVFYAYVDFSDAWAYYGTLQILVTFPNFYLIMFFLSFTVMLSEIGINFIYVNMLGLPHNLIRKYVSMKENLNEDQLKEEFNILKSKITSFEESKAKDYEVQREIIDTKDYR